MAGGCLLAHVSVKYKVQRDIPDLNIWTIRLHGRKLPFVRFTR